MDKKIAEHLNERGETTSGMENGANCPNMEKGDVDGPGKY